MKVKIKIKTPKGQAEGTLKRLKPFLIGFNKVNSESYVDKDNETMYLECEGTPKQILNITRNSYMYSTFIDNVFKQKVMGKGIVDLANSKEDIAELESMLREGTTVNVIKEATANEILEDNTTMWDRMKKSFKKVF